MQKMLNPEEPRFHKEVSDRYYDRIEELPTFADATPVGRVLYRICWTAWLRATGALARLGVPHSFMCDTTKDIEMLSAEFAGERIEEPASEPA